MLDYIKSKSFALDSMSTTSDVLSAIDTGIQTEIQSISVYQLTRKTLIDKFAPLLDAIIDEEESHLRMLQKFKEEQSKTNG